MMGRRWVEDAMDIDEDRSNDVSEETEDILIPLTEAEDDSTFYTYSLNIVSWLSGTVPHPAVFYLVLVPVSFPLIGLTQLVQYLFVCRVANLTPGEL